MSKQGYVAFDLGAESGRAILATIENDIIEIEEAHRFPNGLLPLPSGIHWNFTSLWAAMLEGLKKTAALAEERGVELVSLGVDTWGVDFGFIGKAGQLLGLPVAYRDPSHEKAMTTAFEKVSREKMYDATGIQIIFLNSLFQLVARNEQDPDQLKITDKLLFIPDLLHYFFCGNAVNEATIASTSGVADPRTGGWATGLIDDLGLPQHIFTDIVPAGTVLGELLPEISKHTGVDPIKVIAPATHDTASAIAAVPYDEASGKTWAYISSGTWSLMGAELPEPLINEATRSANFTNEWGIDNTIRLLKNLAGLWLVQECKRDFATKGEEFDYDQLTDLAAEAEPLRTLINPAHSDFIAPGGMPDRIAAFAKNTGQPIPETRGQFVRCCLESLAFAYRAVLEELEEVLGHRIDVLHIVGGGGKNALLNQLTCDVINRPVIVGPYEGTAIGNALVQGIGTGQVKDLAHLRQIVRNSFEIETYEPKDPGAAEAEYERYRNLVNG